MLIRICLALALPLGVGQTAPPAGWRSFAPKDDAFTVALPFAPMEKKQQLKAPEGDGMIDVSLYLCEGAKVGMNEGTLVVGVSEYPPALVQGGEEKRLKHARDGAVQNAKGKLFHERKIALTGYPGRELWIEIGEERAIHMRLFAVKQRLYQTMALGTKDFIESKEAAAFMDSFKLKK
jgi:hypothetical protein